MAAARIALVTISAVLTGCSVSAATPIEVRFEDIPNLVGERNLHAQGAELLKRSAAAQRGHLGRSFYPSLSASLGTEKFKTGSQTDRSEPFGSLAARLNLYRGGRDRLQDDFFNAEFQSASADVDFTLSEEVKKARSLYWRLISEREIADLLKTALEENGKNLSTALTRIRAGAATETDRIEFEMYQIELEQDLARAKLAEDNSQRELIVVLGLPDDSKLQTPSNVDHAHSDAILSTPFAADRHPSIAMLTARSQAADNKASGFGRWWTPSLDLYAGYGLFTFREREHTPQSERFESVVGVQLTMALFDGLIEQNERRQKLLEAAGLQKESQQAAKELTARIDSARAALRLNHDLIHQSEEALKRAKLYLSRTLDEYRRGVKNSPDVLSASERNFAMKRRFAELRRDYQLARSELLALLGQ